MAFDLAKAAGYDKLVSNLDTMDVTMVPVDKIDANEKNFFSVDDVQDLKESIQVNGILQPLNVVRAGDRYRIIAGHRRFKAATEAGLMKVPAVVLPEMSESMEWFMLIKTNTTARELSYLEKSEAAIRLKKHLVQMKAEGVPITGRLRDIVSEQLEISKTELARMEVIDKGLIQAGKDMMKKGDLQPSHAYALAKAPADVQAEMLEYNVIRRGADAIEKYAAGRAMPWIERDCPLPDGFWQHEEKRMGHLLQCPSWERIQAHKAKGHPESCCGCCAKCSLYESGYHCPDVCANAKARRATKLSEETRKKQAADVLARREAAKAHFQTTPFANIGKAIAKMVGQGPALLDDLAEKWNDQVLALVGDDGEPEFDGGHVSTLIHAETLGDVDYDLISFVALCNAVGKTPNELLGFDCCSGWIPFDVQKPEDGARIVVRKISAGGNLAAGEYIYRNGRFWNIMLPDWEMGVSRVTHWIYAPKDLPLAEPPKEE